MQQNQANGNSGSSNLIHRRRPHVWQDDMAEVKETFRRVARARHSRGYSAGETSPTRVTAPILSRNRRARIRCQVPVKTLHMSPGCLQVPVKVLQEIQGNRSQSPFVSLNHLQNVLGMCRRIRSQQSLTERKKNPHDPAVYPVYVRRPWSVSACVCHKSQVNPSSPNPLTPNMHVSPSHSHFHFKGYAHMSPNIHPSHVISSQHDVIPGHVRANAHHQSSIESINDISPSAKHQATHASSNCCHISPNCHVSSKCHISPSCHVSPNTVHSLPSHPHTHSSPNNPSTPLYYKPARFKPLYDISNGVFPHSHMRKRAPVVALNEKLRTSAHEKPLWTHYRNLILHPSVEDAQHANPLHAAGTEQSISIQQNLDLNNVLSVSSHGTPFARSSVESLIATKKPRTRSFPMGLSESWPSSSSSSNDPHHQHHRIHFVDDFRAHFNCNELADFLNSDRRPHSENDLNLHSASYLLERPPSRCMKRPLSSCSSSWRNVSAFLQGSCRDKDLECGYADAWSPNTSSSQQDDSFFIPRDLNGNILQDLPCSYKSDASSSFTQKQPKILHKKAEHKRRLLGGALSDLSKKQKAACTGQNLMQRNNHVYNSSSKGCTKISAGGGVRKEKPIMASTSSCLDDLEGLPPSKWAKKLASDLMGPYRAKANSTSDHYKEISIKAHMTQPNCSFGNGFKHRVKFASPSVQINNNGFRKEAQSLAAAETIPDLLSWERDSGLLTGDPPAIAARADDDDEEEELDQKLLEQVEAMLDAFSTSSSPSPSPSPSRESPGTSPMHVCTPVQQDCVDSCSKSITEMGLLLEGGGIFGDKAINGVHHIHQEDYEKQHLQEEGKKEQAEISVHVQGTRLDMSSVDESLSEEEVKSMQAPKDSDGKPHVNGSVVNIHHNVALIEVMESTLNMEARNMCACVEDQVMKSAEPSPKLSGGMQKGKGLGGDNDEGLLKRGGDQENAVRRMLLEEKDVNEDGEYGRVEHKDGEPCAPDAEWELEKLFQDSLDLNPTFRHLYDTMSHLNACVAPVPKQIPFS